MLYIDSVQVRQAFAKSQRACCVHKGPIGFNRHGYFESRVHLVIQARPSLKKSPVIGQGHFPESNASVKNLQE